MSRWHVLREPAVPMLLLACVVHAVRRNLFDLLLFGGTAVLIVVDSWRAPASGGGPRWRHARPSRWIWLVVIGFAVLTAPLPRSGVGIQIVLAGVGLAALAVLLLRRAEVGPAGPRPSGTVRGWPAWAILAVLACLWELTSFAVQQADPATDAAHPTMSDLIGPLLADGAGRVVFLALWAAGGIWLLRGVLGNGGGRTQQVDGSTGAEGEERRPRPDPHHAGSGGST